jgi:hypothetical protein
MSVAAAAVAKALSKSGSPRVLLCSNVREGYQPRNDDFTQEQLFA